MALAVADAPRWKRTLVSQAVALVAAIALFWLMQFMIHVPEGDPNAGVRVDDVASVPMDQPKDQPQDAMQQLANAPPPPPAAPGVPDVNAPTIPVVAVSAPIEAGPISVPTSLGAGGMTLGATGAFGGFAGGSGGGGGAGGGYGKGEGFAGKELIPLSTARPQIPEWAYRKGIEGWVEVVFTVMPNGHVQDIKIIDAEPKGVFEPAAVESISNWIYAEYPKARTVKQKVEFKLEDFQYNWR